MAQYIQNAEKDKIFNQEYSTQLDSHSESKEGESFPDRINFKVHNRL